MNYSKHYNTLIKRSQERILEGYVEKHHIVPKCMGGTDDISNLVVLTPEEHFVAHQLLVKMYPSNHKLIFAANMMCINNPFQRRGNKIYSWLKKKVTLSLSKAPRKKRAKETKPRKKRTLSEEHKRKLAIASTRKKKPKLPKVDGRKASANRRPSFYCEHCKLTVKGESNWKQHLNSKGHKLWCQNL